MLGIAIGTLSAIGLIKLARDRHRERFAYARGCEGGRHRGWHGRRSWLSGLFWRLDTTPEQERTIEEAVFSLRDSGQAARDNARRAGAQLASALKTGGFQGSLDGEVSTRLDAAYQDMRDNLRTTLQKIHDTLDEKQRVKLGEMLERRIGNIGW